jgi:hypothetical protein
MIEIEEENKPRSKHSKYFKQNYKKMFFFWLVKLTSAIMSRFGGCLWDGSTSGEVSGWLFLQSAPNFVSVTPSKCVWFPILRRKKVSTLLSSFFMSVMCFANWIFGILSFWVNMRLSVSTYYVCSFAIGLPHSGRYPPDPSICLRITWLNCF